MNTPIRRLAVLVFVMFATLLVSTTWIQFGQADELRDRPENRRTLLDTYSRDRGPILVDGSPIAVSEETDDELQRIRTYPEGSLYAHVTGYFSFLYGADGGIEGARNSVLSGTADMLFYRRIADVITGRDPQGAALELTIDQQVQQAASDALGDRTGAAVALNPQTGEILAMVSKPTYNPADLASHRLASVEDSWAQLSGDPQQPLINRTIAGALYPPGSTFKLVAAAAALENGYQPDSELEAPLTYTLPNTNIELPNFGGRDCSDGETATLARSIEVSCNTSFAWLAGELGADTLRSQAQAFGFGEQVDVPMDVTPSSYPDDPDAPQVALTGIGQHEVRVTPLQVAMVSAGIANGGSVMTPHLVESVRTPDLDVIEEADQQELSQAIEPETAQELTEMMVSVVESGSGGAARIDGVDVAGKTGTAEYGENGAAHAWFTGFAPADDPNIAVAVIVESASDDWTGATGGDVAAPIAQQILQAGVNR